MKQRRSLSVLLAAITVTALVLGACVPAPAAPAPAAPAPAAPAPAAPAPAAPAPAATAPSEAASPTTAAPAAAAAGKTTIEIWDFQQSDKKILDAQKQAIAGFEQANPDITVNVTVFPYEVYRDKLLTAVQGGKPPDISNSRPDLDGPVGCLQLHHPARRLYQGFWPVPRSVLPRRMGLRTSGKARPGACR